MARDPALIQLINSGDEAALQRRAAQLYQAFPFALALRIFRRGSAHLDNSVSPPIGYACLDVINSVERGNMSPAVEVHAPNTSQAHVEIVRPILDKGNPIGVIQLALDTKVIGFWLEGVSRDHYIELMQQTGEQPSVMLGKIGNSDLRNSLYTYRDVRGTRWKVAVWSPASETILPITLQAVFFYLIGVVLMGFAFFSLKRSVSNTVREDAGNLIKMSADNLRGVRQHDYHFVMPEVTEVARRIDELQDKSSTERERDYDPNAINVNSAKMGQLDPLAVFSGGVSVEELDESEVMPKAQAQAATSAQDKAIFSARDPNMQFEPHAMTQSAPTARTAGATQDKPGTTPTASAAPQNAPAKPPKEIFKAYDIRGVVGVSLTAQHAQLIGRAIGSEAVARGLTKLVFARDGRLSGPELGGAFVKGVQQSGVDVIDIGMLPTPVLYYAANELANGTGVMLTGSHNPPQYNGFKMMLGGETLSGEAIQALRERIENDDFATGEGHYSNQSVAKAYIERIIGDVKLKRPMNIVIDCGNGVAGAIAPLLFKSMGCRVTELYCDVDGKFPNHHPDPSKPENMQDLIATVKGKGADLGIAFDGDGDRLGVVDAGGKIIYPDRYMMLFAADVLANNHGAQIIYDIKCSNNLTRVIWEKGGEPLMWKTGHSLIKAKLKQTGAPLAGEMSGHIFFNDRWYGFDDGLYSGARLLEILSKTNTKSDAVFGALPDAVNTPELNVQMREGETHKFIEDLMMRADFGEANVSMIDGIRADFNDGWGLVRASNTTPVLVLRFEGKDARAMGRIQQLFKAQMLAVKPDLKLPF
ncbi:MAG: phosphomannomutase/phosphoglucomutase [Gammaproteobacteria bacterium]|nr:phosphomannomutase/phosphoglucomutase [Gammaproteobacteria bacterium]